MHYLKDLTLFAIRPSTLNGSRRLEAERASKSRRRVTTQDVVNSTALAGFNQISTGLFRLCRCYGSKLQILNAWSVHNSMADELEAKLRGFEERFNTLVEQFVRDFPRLNLEWANERPDERDDILRLAYTEQELREGFRFAMARFQLHPEQIQAQTGLAEEITGLAGTAFREFADMVKDVGVKDPGKHLFTGGISTTLGQIARKAGALSFLDPRMGEVAQVLKDLITMLPARGRVEGANAVLLRIVVDRLMNPAILAKEGFPKLETESTPEPRSIPTVTTPKRAATKARPAPPIEDDDDIDTSWCLDDTQEIPALSITEALDLGLSASLF